MSFAENYLKLREQRKREQNQHTQNEGGTTPPSVSPETPSVLEQPKTNGSSQGTFAENYLKLRELRQRQKQNQTATESTAVSQPKATGYAPPDTSALAGYTERMMSMQAEIDSSKANINDLQLGLDDATSWAQLFSDRYKETGDAYYNAMYQQAYAEYKTALTDYNDAIAANHALVDEYNEIYTQARGIWDNYSAWRDSIRSEQLVSADISKLDRQIADLQQQRAALDTKAKGYYDQITTRRGSPEEMLSWQTQLGDLNTQMQAIDQQISNLQQQKNLFDEELYWSRSIGYEDLDKIGNFETMSAAGEMVDGDVTHNFINNYDGYRAMHVFDDIARTHTKYTYMDEDEIARYNYLYNTGGKVQAEKYLDFLSDTLEQRQGAAIAKGADTTAEKLLFAPIAGINQFTTGAKQLFSEDSVDTNYLSYAGSEMRKDMSGFWGGAYDFLQTVSNMAPSILLSTAAATVTGGLGAASTIAATVGKVAGTAVMAGSAAGNAYKQKLDEGYDAGAARDYALLVGASEGALQYALGGISKLGGKLGGKVAQAVAGIDNGFARFALQLGGKMASEGLEEGLQEVLEPLFAVATLDEEYDGAEWSDIGYSFLLGALSAGLLEGGDVISENRAIKQTGADFRVLGDDVVNALIQSGLAEEQDTTAYKLAKKLQKAQNAGEKISDYQLGRLVAESADLAGNLALQKATDKQNAQPVETTDVEDDLPFYLSDEDGRTERRRQETGATQEMPARAATTQMRGVMLPTAEDTERQREMQRRLERATTDFERNGIEMGADDATIQAAQRVSMATGRKIEFNSKAGTVGKDGKTYYEDGYYDADTGKIHVNAASPTAKVWTLAHELTHSIEKAGSYGKLSSIVLNQYDRATLKAERARITARYTAAGKTLDASTTKAVDAEIVANYVADKLFTNEQAITSLVQQNRSLGQKIMDWIDRVLAKLGNKNAKERDFYSRARRYYAKALAETATVAQTPVTATAAQMDGFDYEAELETLQDKLRNGEITEEEFDEQYNALEQENVAYGNVQNSISELPDGKKYVRADRQVVYGNDPDSWSEQLEDYINGKIRRGQDVELIGEDGDVLVLTAESAGKIASMYNSDGTTMNEEAFERKVSAGSHIDELASVSISDGKNKQDRGNRHGDAASGGWQYRTAFFQDFDGKYYRCTISVEIGNNGNAIYNIGQMQERSFPTTQNALDGSSANGGAQSGKTSSNGIISQPENSVKKFSISEAFAEDVTEWNERGRPDGDVFVLGSTGDVLRGLGAIDNDIYMRGEKISSILSDHEEMNLDIVKRIPEILDDPVLVLKSKNIGRRKANTRLIMFGSIKAENGKPVLAVLDLRPVEGKLVVDDMQKVTSSYTKTTSPVDFVRDSEVLHADKKRTISLLRSVGFQMPIELLRNGSVGSISYSGTDVKLDGVPFSEIVHESSETERQYSVSKDEDTDAVPEATLPKVEAETEETPLVIPAKAQTYFQKVKNDLFNSMKDALGVQAFTANNEIKNVINRIATNFLQTGEVSGLEDLFEAAYETGYNENREFYEQFKHIKTHMQTHPVTISEYDKANIPDFNAWRQQNMGLVTIRNEGGLPVDTAYQQLMEMAPGLFPEDITNPAEQLERMAEVSASIKVAQERVSSVYAHDPDFKKRARSLFVAAANEATNQLEVVLRYIKDADAVEDAAAKFEADIPKTADEITAVHLRMKDAQKKAQKIVARHLLTNDDKAKVNELLRGEATLDGIDTKKYNVEGIKAVYEAKRAVDYCAKLLEAFRKRRLAKLYGEVDADVATAPMWKDKSGLAYSTETMERNIYDIIPNKEIAKRIYEKYFLPVHKAVAASTRLKNEYRERIKALGIKTKPKKGDLVSEAYAVQLVGEAEFHISMLEKGKRRGTSGGYTLEQWRSLLDMLWATNPSLSLDRNRIRRFVEEFRAVYEELYTQINEVRVMNGYEPLGHIEGYFPHFRQQEGEGLLDALGKIFGVQTEVMPLPTEINGKTQYFRPGMRWMANAQHRLGYQTDYDAVEGFDRYIESAADVICLTDSIQRLRAFANRLRYMCGDEGIKKQITNIMKDEKMTQAEKDEMIQAIEINGRFAMSSFVVELDEYTNLLANKKSMMDRGVERMAKRKAYNAVKAAENLVASNMVVYNIGTAITNFAALVQGKAAIPTRDYLLGLYRAIRARVHNDGFAEQSSFLTNRRGSDRLTKTFRQKASDFGGAIMTMVDNYVSESLVRARYSQNIRRGMSHQNALDEADVWVAKIMADRSKGGMPTIFESKNPLIKPFTMFQVEVNNQYRHLFKDLSREAGGVFTWKYAKYILEAVVGAWLFDELYELAFGRRPLPDIVDMIADTTAAANGKQMNNLFRSLLTGEALFEDAEEKSINEIGIDLAEDVAENLPFIGGMLGGGRIPIQSAMPDFGDLWQAVSDTELDNRKRGDILAREASSLLSYLSPFGGGQQLKKIHQGIAAVAKGGSYSINSDGEDELQYPINSDSVWGSAWDYARAAFLGKSSLPEAQDWVESGFDGLSAADTVVYKGMVAAGVDGDEAFELIQDIRDIPQGEGRGEKQRDFLRDSSVLEEGKGILYFGVLASDKERELMELLADDVNVGELADVLMEIRDAGELTGAAASNAKRDAIMQSDMTENQQMEVYRYMFGTKNDNGEYEVSRADDIEAFASVGLDFGAFLEAQNEYTTINEEYDTASEKAVVFSRWVNGQGYTTAQADTIRKSFTFFSQVPADAGKYNDFMDMGLSDTESYKLSSALGALEPLEGEKSVKPVQRWRTIVDTISNPNKQMKALQSVMTDAAYEKLTVATSFDLDVETYVSIFEALPDYDEDGNGSYKNAEVTALLDALGMLPAYGINRLTNAQQAVLWQLITGSTSAKNNPYDEEIGWEVLAARGIYPKNS